MNVVGHNSNTSPRESLLCHGAPRQVGRQSTALGYTPGRAGRGRDRPTIGSTMTSLPITSLPYVLGVAIGLVPATPAPGAEIMFYEHPRFGGRSFSANQTIPNFAGVGFNDRAGSVIIRSGSWQLCSDAYFRGRCVTLNRGEYPT